MVPVPLRDPDPDVALDLSSTFYAIYDEAGYDLSLDYAEPPPPPPLAPREEAWVSDLLSGRRT